MKNLIKLLAISPAILLSGCANVGPQSSFGERMSDNFIFTSGQSVADAQVQCLSLTKSFTFQSGSVTYTLPAGIYHGTRKNGTGYFYYSPSSISSSASSWIVPTPYGIYVNNEFNHGNLFSTNPTGYDSRPIRLTVLPNNIFSSIVRKGNC